MRRLRQRVLFRSLERGHGGEHDFLLVVRHLIEHALSDLNGLLRLSPASIENRDRCANSSGRGCQIDAIAIQAITEISLIAFVIVCFTQFTTVARGASVPPKRIFLVAASAPTHFIEDTPTAVLVRQVLGAVAEFEKTTLVAKLAAARRRKRVATGEKVEGRKSHIEARPDVVKLAKALARKAQRRAKPARHIRCARRTRLPERARTAIQPEVYRRHVGLLIATATKQGKRSDG